MSFHFSYIRNDRVYLAADQKIYDSSILAPKILRNHRAAVSFVGNLTLGRAWAGWALAQNADYSNDQFITASREWCKREFALLEPYGEIDKRLVIFNVYLAARDADGKAFLLIIDRDDDGEFMHKVERRNFRFVAPTPEAHEREIVERQLAPALRKNTTGDFWRHLQETLPDFFSALHKADQNISREFDATYV